MTGTGRAWLRRTRYGVELAGVWCAFGVLACFPLARASAIGGAIGRWLGPRLPVSDIARRNLERALPETSAAERTSIIAAMWENLGRVIAEFPHLANMTGPAFARAVTVAGAERVAALTDSGSSCLFFSGHLANWELAPKTLAMLGRPLALVYRRGNNPGLNRLIQHIRGHYQTEAIAKGIAGARQLVAAIHAGAHIGMLMDQKMNDGIAVDFFGRPAMTAPAIANLALKYDLPIVPVKVVRDGGIRHTVSILAPLVVARSGDRERDVDAIMGQINGLLEEWIRENPGQWLWIHHRWPADGQCGLSSSSSTR